MPACPAKKEPEQISDEDGLLVGLEHHHGARIATHGRICGRITGLLRQLLLRHGPSPQPWHERFPRRYITVKLGARLVPQQLVDRGLCPRALVDALDDDGAIEARPGGAVLRRL